MLAGLVAVVSLNLVALLGYPLWVRHQASSSAPLDARITTSELDCTSYDGVTHCSVQLRAEYDVDGTTYATKLVPAHGIEARPDLSPLDDPHGCVEALPVGSAITVFVDPEHPARGVFHRRPPVRGWLAAGTTGLCIMGFLWFLRPRATDGSAAPQA